MRTLPIDERKTSSVLCLVDLGLTLTPEHDIIITPADSTILALLFGQNQACHNPVVFRVVAIENCEKSNECVVCMIPPGRKTRRKKTTKQ